MKFCLVWYVFLVAASSVSSQSVPSLNTFLQWLFNTASTEIDNITSNFDFRSVSPSDIIFLHHLPNSTAKLHPHNHTLDLSKPIKILIHGWQASASDSSHTDMAAKYHESGVYNVISVDWSEHAKKVYPHSASSTKDIGKILGDFIVKMTKNQTELFENVHLLGVSLGGHVAGFAGQRVEEITGKKVGRITGLDVAAPLFEVPRRQSEDLRLSPDDARFVDVIHTNAGFLGVAEPIGTADFYVENGGPLQPGCVDPLNIFESIGCSHFKAVEYFMDSIGGKKYEALACPNSIQYHLLACNGNKRVVMGENVDKKAKGTFYLETESPLPYSNLMMGFRFNLPRFRIPFVN